MRRKVILSLMSIALAFTLFLPITTIAEGTNEEDIYTYEQESFSNSDGYSDTFYYSHSMLSGDANSFSSDLAIASVGLAT